MRQQPKTSLYTKPQCVLNNNMYPKEMFECRDVCVICIDVDDALYMGYLVMTHSVP